MEKWKQMAISVIVTSLSSQIYMNFFVDGFIIALSPLVLVLFLYLFREVNAMAVCLLVGTTATAFRIIMLTLTYGDFHSAFSLAWFDSFFFYAFGVFYSLFSRSLRRSNISFLAIVFFSDFLGNMTEMTLRTSGSPWGEGIIRGLLMIAAVRTGAAMVAGVAIDNYKSFLMKQEHEERYKKLVIMAAALNGEVYFMNKNMVEIEDVMEKAFTLYRTVEPEEHLPKEVKNMALDIAKDVHEIKKDYIRVIRGIQDGFFADIEINGMRIRDIVRILNMDIHEQIRARGLKVEFTYKLTGSYYVEHHFSLMSVLRNLVVNSIDAMEERGRGKIELVIDEKLDEEGRHICTFDVSDNGPGINPGDMDVIFDPGYSTKFSQETGAINRGVGLTLVRDLIQGKFRGAITVESEEGAYTRFHIEIPRTALGGEEE